MFLISPSYVETGNIYEMIRYAFQKKKHDQLLMMIIDDCGYLHVFFIPLRSIEINMWIIIKLEQMGSFKCKH